jgi:hypothetical protein
MQKVTYGGQTKKLKISFDTLVISIAQKIKKFDCKAKIFISEPGGPRYGLNLKSDISLLTFKIFSTKKDDETLPSQFDLKKKQF